MVSQINNVRRLAVSLVLVTSIQVGLFAQSRPAYMDPNLNTEKRIELLMQNMTLEEKLTLLGGDKRTEVDMLPIERLGIPAIKMSDGPHGVRIGNATCFPVAIAMASSWDEELIQRFGAALGKEILGKGKQMILGPCINLHRVPQGGRNFESFSEDPYVAGKIAAAYIRGVQSVGAIPSVKHFCANNQEWNRKTIDTTVSERALRELYLPAFKMAIDEANVWNVMSAYNRVNGYYMAENKYLVRDILKDEWGFKGFVVSDWGAVHSTIGTANAGTDVEMPYLKYMGAPLIDEVREGNVSMSEINDKVSRILRVMIWSGMLDGKTKGNPSDVDSPEHRKLALEMAQKSITLLKNDGDVLPLKKDKIKKIAVIGPNADVAKLGGSGSSEVAPSYSVSPLEGIKKKLGQDVEVVFAKGCWLDSFEDIMPIDSNCIFTMDGKPGLLGEYFANINLEGEPMATRVDTKMDFWWGYNEPATGVPLRNFSVRWTGKIIPKETSLYTLAIISEPGSRLFLNDELLLDNWYDHQVVTKAKDVQFEAGKEYKVRFEYYEKEHYAIARLGWRKIEKDLIAEAVEAAKNCDAAIIVGGVDKPFEGEGHDRPELGLPGRQDELIAKVAAVNKNTVVVLNNGTPILMDKWIGSVPAIVEAWYPGQEGGNAVADILFGDVNPSGKLTCTFPKKWEDSSAYGSFKADPITVTFSEDIFMGYRHFDKKKIEPLFCFGHGLSYTKFEYSDLKVSPEHIGDGDKVTVSLNVKNTGKTAGAEVVQLYVRDIKSSVDRPMQELKGFKKVNLEVGETKEVVFEVNKQAMSFYDVANKKWTAEPGCFEVRIGSSSRDIRLKGGFELKQ